MTIKQMMTEISHRNSEALIALMDYIGGSVAKLMIHHFRET